VSVDNDGTADCKDQCPTDVTKTAAGICGCGIADDDSGFQKTKTNQNKKERNKEDDE
jgi:hypothetical protein